MSGFFYRKQCLLVFHIVNFIRRSEVAVSVQIEFCGFQQNIAVFSVHSVVEIVISGHVSFDFVAMSQDGEFGFYKFGLSFEVGITFVVASEGVIAIPEQVDGAQDGFDADYTFCIFSLGIAY